jgi:LPS-assembly protein
MNKLYSKILLILIIFAPFNIYGVSKDSSIAKETLIEAEKIDYDHDTAIAVAYGNVEFIQGERILLADKVTYNNKENKVFAYGNVSILDEQGNVYFASQAELKDDLKEGIVQSFKVKLKNDAAFASQQAEIIGDNIVKMKDTVYSACQICQSDPKKRLPWQIRSSEVVIDNNEQRVTHKHARLEAYGIPIIYTPYFSHPTPKAKRKSGFLIPRFSSSGQFGNEIVTPFYWNIAPDMDMTIKPHIYSKKNPMVASEFRHLVEKGSYSIHSSLTQDNEYPLYGSNRDKNKFRGHIFFGGTYGLPDSWGMVAEFKRASDRTYLKKYRLNNDDYLTSKIDISKMTNNDLYQAQLYSFQDFRFNDGSSIPKILPILNLYKETDLNDNNQKFYVKANAANLLRRNDTSMQRLSTEVTAKQLLNSDNGNLIDVAASLRLDGYKVEKLPDPFLANDRNTDYSGTSGRIVPKIVANWSYPWLATLDKANFIIEPLAQIALSPHGGNNPAKIPNEDSSDIEIYDNNIFNDNKFSGYDRVEEGLRGAFGFKTSLMSDKGYGFSTLFGQAYNHHRQKEFQDSSGLKSGTSDYVGRATLHLSSTTNINYRFRLSRDNLSRQRSDINIEYNYAPIYGDIGISSFHNSPNLILGRNSRVERTIGSHKILHSNGGMALTKKININGGFTKILTSRNVRADKRFVNAESALQYNGDCVDWRIFIKRDFTRTGDIRPDTVKGFELSLKTLR